MKYFYMILFFISITTGTFAQKKKTTPSVQPYSISNIRIGMPLNEFVTKYPDSISHKQIKTFSKVFVYDALIINNIEVYDVMITFYKDKLVDVYFKTIDPMMNIGLSAKYEYSDEDEYTEFYEDKLVTISHYGKFNSSYGLTRIKFEETEEEGFIMSDKKGKKLALAEGF